MQIHAIATAFAGLLVYASQVPAVDDIRCGGQIVSVGDSEQILRERCGEPDAIRGVVRSFNPSPDQPVSGAGTPENPNVVWIYKGGAGQFGRTITIEGGVITQIQEGVSE